MEKAAADRIITEYVSKIYGFALSKTGNSRAAEELASDITYEVYLSLLRDGTIYNINAYIWRISSFVYARFAERERKRQAKSSGSLEKIHTMIAEDGGRLPEALIDRNDPAALFRMEEERAAHREDLRRLRREIAYLGETRRQIIVAHYYGGQTVCTIAQALRIPEGTVKWHLHSARNTIKEGIHMERDRGTLGIEPIRLVNMGHNGYPGTTGDTSNHLATRLAQNIAYAAYDEPKSETEIAEELGVTPVYLAEIIEDLEKFAFMTRLPNGKLRTDIIIERSTKEANETIHALKQEYTRKIAEAYIEQMIANMDAYITEHRDRIYLPDGNRNLWLWNAFMLGFKQSAFRLEEDISPEVLQNMNRFCYKRPDGGEYTAFACLYRDYMVDYDPDRYGMCGFMERMASRHDTVRSVQCSTCYDTRPGNWEDNQSEDYSLLYECYTGALPETPTNVERYRRLFERGLIIRREGKLSVNVPVILSTPSLPSLDLFRGIDIEAYKALLREYTRRNEAITLPFYPAHIRNCVRALNSYPHYEFIMYLYEWMLENGILQLPEDERRGGLMTILFAPALPEG